MNSKNATSEREHFSNRLQMVLRNAGIPLRAAAVAREFNLRAEGATVTTHAVRKWLMGEAIPTHERMVILSGWLGVHASWLLYGDAESGAYRQVVMPSLATEELILLRDYRRLSADGQKIMRAMLTTLLGTLRKGAGEAERPAKSLPGPELHGNGAAGPGLLAKGAADSEIHKDS